MCIHHLSLLLHHPSLVVNVNKWQQKWNNHHFENLTCIHRELIMFWHQNDLVLICGVFFSPRKDRLIEISSFIQLTTTGECWDSALACVYGWKWRMIERVITDPEKDIALLFHTFSQVLTIEIRCFNFSSYPFVGLKCGCK